jgi:elongation factor P
MIDVNELKKGITFESDGNLFKVLDYSHNKSGRGKASIKVKARNLLTGATLEKTFISGDRVQDVRLEYRNLQYLYYDGDIYHFMDTETYEQPGIDGSLMGDSAHFLSEGLQAKVTFYEGRPIDIELPTTVDLRIIHAEVAVRGDTATGVNKKVEVETGYSLEVPNFVNDGDLIRIDTRTGAYVTRVTE